MIVWLNRQTRRARILRGYSNFIPAAAQHARVLRTLISFKNFNWAVASSKVLANTPMRPYGQVVIGKSRPIAYHWHKT